MAKVVIYSTPTCVYCKMAKEYFNSRGIQFTDIDVSADQAKAQELYEKSGGFSVPVIDIDGAIVVGFDKRRLEELLPAEGK